MNTPYLTHRHLLSAILAFDFEFVSLETCQTAIYQISQGNSPNIFDDVSSDQRLDQQQREIIDNLIERWISESKDLPSLIVKYTRQRMSSASSDKSDLYPTSGDSIQKLVGSAFAQIQGGMESTNALDTIDTRLSSSVDESATSQATIDETTKASTEMSFEVNKNIAIDHAEQLRQGSDEHSRYEILELLAEGGLGKVSIARDKQLGRNVAFKQIKTPYAGDNTSQRRFVFEAAITGQLEHPGIVPVYSLGRDDNQNPFYAMRLIEGKSLREAIHQFHNQNSNPGNKPAIKKGKLEFRQLLKRFIDLCETIDFAHSRGVIHRDLKPSNIMVGSFGETFVVDWGLARHLHSKSDGTDVPFEATNNPAFEKTLQGTVVGTPSYMSPEQASGEVNSLQPSSDIFALGTIFYSILTGAKAFRQTSSIEILRAVKSCDFDEPIETDSTVPRPLNEICMKAMSKSPDQRYQSAGAFAQDVERWLADEPVAAWNEPIITKAGRWVRNHKTLVTSALALFLTTTLALMVVSALQRDSNLKLQAANKKEKVATQDAQFQFELAQKRFELALDAVSQYHNGVTHDFILQQDEFAELRKQLLAAPRKFYRELNKTITNYSRPSVAQKRALIDSHMQLSALAGSLNDPGVKLSELNTALELCREIVSDNNNDIELQLTHARILSEMAATYRDTGEYEEGQDAFESSIKSLEKLSKLAPGNDKIKKQLTTSYTRFGSLLTATGKHKQAIEVVKQGIAIDQNLASEEKTDMATRNLAVSYHFLSNSYMDMNELDSAIEYAEQCKLLYEKMSIKETNNPQMIHEISGNLVNLAYMYQVKNRLDDALALYDKAEDAYRALVAAAPNIARFKSALASTLNNKGLLFDENENHVQAREMYEQSLRIKERMTEDAPNVVEQAISLGGGYVNFGGYFHRLRDYQAAIQWYSKGIETLTPLVEKLPGNKSAETFLLNAYSNRYLAFRRVDDHKNAINDMEYLLSHVSDPGKLRSIKGLYAQSNAFIGNHNKASQLAVEMRPDSVSDRDFYNLAFIHALAVESANADSRLTEPEKIEVLSKYVTRAIEDLRAMYETKALSKAQFLDLLKNNPYMKPLHGDQAFERFVSEFE